MTDPIGPGDTTFRTPGGARVPGAVAMAIDSNGFAVPSNAVVAETPAPVATTVTVASGQSLSAAVPLASGKPAGVQLPADIDSATKLTFQLSYDGGATYNDMYDATGSEYSVTVAASRSVPINHADFVGATHMKVRLGTTGSPVTATADRTLKFSLLP